MPSSSNNGAHILLFPYPTSGHIIPLLDLANKLLSRGLIITILITPPNLHLLDPLLSTHPHSNSLHPLILPFPTPSADNLAAKVYASFGFSEPIISWFKSHKSPPVAIVSDFFLGWTNRLASQIGIPRIVFWPSAAQQSLLIDYLWRNIEIVANPIEENSVISFANVPKSPSYPWWQVSELASQYREGDPIWEFIRECLSANIESWGAVFNSFTELEGLYIDHTKREMGHERVWAVGPLLPSDKNQVGSSNRGGSSAVPVDDVIDWLNSKPNDSVIYVCFGSQVELTGEQIGALAAALECSGVQFVWCVRQRDIRHVAVISQEYEHRVAGRGLIIKGWAPQVEILKHAAVCVFVTHCGWNSILEGIAAGVVMLTWPMGADQFTNAKYLVEEIGVATSACEGGSRTVPESTKLGQLFVEAVSGGCRQRERVLQLRDFAAEAVENGGSSSRDLDDLVERVKVLKAGAI